MIRNRILLKSFSTFFIVEILVNTVAPVVSFALTSGPTAPEYSTFVPWDDSDIVNLNTGDLNYNIPLLEVPGPDGGYPLNLNYSSGIKTNQEASWVGLGFNLNAGSITRSVNGFADDFNAADFSVHDEWEGGNAYKEGAGLILGGCGLWVETNWSTHSAYKDVDMDYELLMAGIDTRGKGNVRLTVNFNINDFIKGNSETVTNANYNNLQSQRDLDLTPVANYFLQGSKTTSVHNNSANHVQTKEVSSKRYFVYEYSKTKYWIDETDNSKMFGSLNGKSLPDEIPNDHAFDRYILGEVLTNPDFDNSGNIRSNNEIMSGPSFPAYDVYNVSGQGMQGAMQPKILDNPTLFDRKKVDYKLEGREFDISYIKHKREKLRTQFRFVGDFSNSFRAENVDDYHLDANGASIVFNHENLGFEKIVNANGFDNENFRLSGSTNIQYFENNEILNSTARSQGFIDYVRSTGREQFEGYSISSQVGGFSITNKKGVTYHYALPVYTYKNIQENRRKDEAGKYSTRKITSNQPYAYTWLLTAITGSDFVDRNANGIADEADWGYWTNFVYGRSTKDYTYRNPSEFLDYYIEEDGSESSTNGKKELYYLDAIYTRSHTCLFIKSIRLDGKGTIFGLGGFGIGPPILPGDKLISAPTLRLDEIMLLNNEDLANGVLGIGYNQIQRIDAISNIHSSDILSSHFSLYNSQIITKEDISSTFPKPADILRTIKLKYDYSLCPNTPNSFSINYADRTASSQLSGKLTLKGVSYFGEGAISSIPGYSFNYEVDGIFVGSIVDLHGNQNEIVISSASSGQVKVGDIIKFNVNNKVSQGVIVEKFGQQLLYVRMLGDKPTSLKNNVLFKKTKNPAYNKNLYDVWGFYKPDITDLNAINVLNNDLLRQPSELSSNCADVWSLRSVKMPMGSKLSIDYSSKSYTKVGVNKTKIINILPKTGAIYSNNPGHEYITQNHKTNYNGGHATYLRLYYLERDLYRYLKKILIPGNRVGIVSMTEQMQWIGLVGTPLNLNADQSIKPTEGEVVIEKVTTDYIEISDPDHLFIDYKNSANVAATDYRHFFSYLKLPQDEVYGGGVKVSSLEMELQNSLINKTTYSYSGGTTACEPIGFNGLNVNENFDWEYFPQKKDIKAYKSTYFNSFKRLMYISSELPSPAVSYETCTIRNFVDNLKTPSYKRYTFKVFDESLFKADENDQYHYEFLDIDGGSHESRTLKLNDFTSCIGSIQTVAQLSSIDDMKLSEVIYTYGDASEYNFQGVLDEVYNEHRVIHPHDNRPDIHMANVSIRSRKPSILKGVTSVDYKTGITVTNLNRAFDFYSGDLIESLSMDGYGNKYLTEILPAYLEYDAMGLSLKGGRNMLTQQAGNYTYALDMDNNKVGLVSASAQTWKKDIKTINPSGVGNLVNPGQYNIWRKESAYSWRSDGESTSANEFYPYINFQPFNFSNPEGNLSNWQKDGTIKLYDVYSHELEVSDMHEHYAATKMSIDGVKVLASAFNSSYHEFAYTGFEDVVHDLLFGIDIYIKSGSISKLKRHTGPSCLAIPANQLGLEAALVTSTARSHFHVSLWINELNVENAQLYYKFSPPGLGGVGDDGIPLELDISKAKMVSGWYQFNIDIPVPSDSQHEDYNLKVSVGNKGPSGTIYIDDFRVHPIDASVNSYVYADSGELDYILDGNNLFTRFIYDDMGRLTEVHKETFQNGTLKTNSYEYNSFCE